MFTGIYAVNWSDSSGIHVPDSAALRHINNANYSKHGGFSSHGTGHYWVQDKIIGLCPYIMVICAQCLFQRILDNRLQETNEGFP